MDVFDIDGTLILNDLPTPDWNNPASVHPTTGENVSGDMPQYWAANRANPELRPDDCSYIRTILTGRPWYREKLTRTELGMMGIAPYLVYMYPSNCDYSHANCIYWKHLILIHVEADYYVDNDPELCGTLQKLLDDKGSGCKCISLAEWQQIIDARNETR